MDLHVLMANRQLLQCLAKDLLDDTTALKFKRVTTLVGDKEIKMSVDFDSLESTLKELSTNDSAALWQLQYTLAVCAYVSDPVVNWLSSTVDAKQMKYWFDGHATLPDFRSRFETHLVGRFSKKPKKGSRKQVVVEATTPQMHAVSEYLLAHSIVSWD